MVLLKYLALSAFHIITGQRDINFLAEVANACLCVILLVRKFIVIWKLYDMHSKEFFVSQVAKLFEATFPFCDPKAINITSGKNIKGSGQNRVYRSYFSPDRVDAEQLEVIN